jgi:N-acetylglucosaminyldiphosphoundecaprenol N-acetyl-beta-D-mannosaminyltransferase
LANTLSVKVLGKPQWNDDFASNSLGTPPSLENIAINIEDLNSAIDNVVSCARAGQGFCFFTVNLDHLVKLQSDARFAAAYRAADFVSADGWPVVSLLRRQGYVLRRTTGADLVEPLCASAADNALRVYFIGPGREQQRDALNILQDRHPDLAIAGAESPMLSRDFSDAEAEAIADRIVASHAQLCFISLGAPKQEVLAHALRRRCPHVGFLCVGGALDFISGHTPRAPRVVQALRLEWLWRMASDPRRLGPRYLKCLAWFAWAILRSTTEPRSAGLSMRNDASSRAPSLRTPEPGPSRESPAPVRRRA